MRAIQVRNLARALIVVLLLAAVAVVLYMSLRGTGPVSLLRNIAVTIQSQAHSLSGMLIYLLVFFFASLLGVIPLGLFAILGGALYGMVAGLLLSAAATVSGAMAAFLLCRHAFRSAIHAWLSEHVALARMDREIARHGWRFVLLFRLSPLFPFSLGSYALGLTEIKPVAFLVGTAGAIPNMIVLVSTGALSGLALDAMTDLQGRAGLPEAMILAVGLVATIVINIYLVRIARRALRDIRDPACEAGQAGSAGGDPVPVARRDPASATTTTQSETNAMNQ